MTTLIVLVLVVINVVIVPRRAEAGVGAWSTGCDPARIGQICTMYAQVSDPPAQYVSWSKLGSDRTEVSLVSRTEVPWFDKPIKKRLLRRSGLRGLTVTSVSADRVVTSMLIFKVTAKTAGRYRCNFYLDGPMTVLTRSAGKG